MKYTKFGGIEAAEVKGKVVMTNTGVAKTSKADAVAAAGSAPTKAEFDAVVELVNDLKAKYNATADAITE